MCNCLHFLGVRFVIPLKPAPSRAGHRSVLFAGSLGLLMVSLLVTLALAAPSARADQTDQEKLDATQSKIDSANQKKEVLSGEITGYTSKINSYETQVQALRAEEADAEARLQAKQDELDAAQAQVDQAYKRLEILAARLKRSLNVLADRIVAIYQSGDPDVSSLVLSSESYGDFIQRSEYLSQIQNQDQQIVGRVRDLRNQQHDTFVKLKKAKDTIKSSRDEIAAEEANLATARQAVESQQNELAAARAQRQAAVDKIDSNLEQLDGVAADLQAKVQAQLLAAAGTTVLPAGPMTAPSSAGLIAPVSGPITSGFGGRSSPGGIGTTYHEGLDFGVPEGTPIRAAKSGTVTIAAYTGGYGNYTCIDHGGGLSTCYGHQSAYAVSVGQSVNQGQIIGYSGNTGNSTGPHLHFEVRINGTAVDPLGYL